MNKIGLYIHIPFCKKKCLYCDFNSYAGIEKYISAYINALDKEIDIYTSKLYNYKITSIYFGGGTPSYIPPVYIYKVLEKIFDKLNLSNSMEISIEVNPGTIDENKIDVYKQAGVNRLSFGVQSCQQNILSKIGRIHRNQDFMKNYWLARKKGFNNINVDLMFGIPTQKMEDWESTLKQIIKLNPEHISCYSLMLSKNTALYKMVDEGKLAIPDEQLDRSMYRFAKHILKDNGYKHYEISNFCKPKRQCRHNLIYWLNRQYLGLGCGAHSYLFGKRFANTNNILEYIQQLNNNKLPIVFSQNIDLSICMYDQVMLAMRLTEGLNKKTFKKHFGISVKKFIINKNIQFLKDQNLLYENDKYIKLTDKGMDVYNSVIIELLP